MAAWVLETILHLLHPVMPFVTEELWDRTAPAHAPRESLLIGAPWPELPEGWIDAAAEAEIGWLVSLITEVRQLRAEMSVPPAARPTLALIGAVLETETRLDRHRDLILTLGRLEFGHNGRGGAGRLRAFHDRRKPPAPWPSPITLISPPSARAWPRRLPGATPMWTAPPGSWPTPISWPARRRTWSKRTERAWPKPRTPRPGWSRPWRGWRPWSEGWVKARGVKAVRRRAPGLHAALTYACSPA